MVREWHQHIYVLTSLCALALWLSACSGAGPTRYRAEPDDYQYPHGKDRALGTFHINGTPDEPQNQIHLYKVRKGYALRGYIDENPEHATALRISRDKEYKWFGGFEWRWNF